MGATRRIISLAAVLALLVCCHAEKPTKEGISTQLVQICGEECFRMLRDPQKCTSFCGWVDHLARVRIVIAQMVRG